MWYLSDGCAFCSGLFLAEMSVDRAIAVMFPMKAATICTASNAAKVVIATGAFEMLLHVMTFFVLRVPDPPNGALLRDVPHARWFEKLYKAYLLVFGTILPFSTLAICNIAIIIEVNRAARRRKKMKSEAAAEKPGKAKDANLTGILFMTSLAYLVCSCPKRAYEAVAATNYDETDRGATALYWLAFHIVSELWILNFAVNFYMYFLGGGKKFRQDARDIFKKCVCCVSRSQ
jgi:hypothetical protein